MLNTSEKLVILNESAGKWAFENLAQMLARSIWAAVSDRPGDLNYILCTNPEIIDNSINSFIPIESIKIAADKREIERRFKTANVARPTTFIATSLAEIDYIINEFDRQQWILKYPTGCGGIHHQLITDVSQIPAKWPRPFLIQSFIETIEPAVYRFYCVDRDLFGFNARKFVDPSSASPWVSHANGARYDYTETPDRQAIAVAKSAIIATGLYDSFGAVDLVKDRHENWYALEVGTDGIYNHVDRDLDNDPLQGEINERLAIAIWKKIGTPPWGKTWKYRD